MVLSFSAARKGSRPSLTSRRFAASIVTKGPRCAGAKKGGCPMEKNLCLIEGAEAFSKGEFDGVALENGCLVLEQTGSG